MSDVEEGEEWVDGGEDEGPCAKIQSSCAMMVLGLVLFPLSLYMVGWNENNYVCEQKRIIFASDNAKTMECDSKGVSDQFGYFACPLNPATLGNFAALDWLDGDDDFYTSNKDKLESVKFSAVSGQMTAEVRQCKRQCTTKTVKVNGKNVNKEKCTYEAVWSTKVEERIDDTVKGSWTSCPGLRRYQGPSKIPKSITSILGSKIRYAEGVETDVKGEAEPFKLNQGLVEKVSPKEVAHAPVYLPAATQDGPGREDCISDSDALIGCVRLSFKKSTATSVSVFTRVVANGETKANPMPSSWGCPGKPWQELMEGTLAKGAAVQTLNDANDSQVILLRIGFVLLAWVSVYCILSPISAIASLFGGLANMIPCVGGYLEDFIEGVVDTILCVISCSVGLSCSLFVMGVVWLFMRPVWGAGMLLVCAALCACACFVRQQAGPPKKRQAREITGGAAASMEMQTSSASVNPVVPMAAQPMAQPMMGQPMNSAYAPPVFAAQPMAVAQPAVAQAVAMPQPVLMQVVCPANTGPGQAIFVQAPDGRQLQVTIPAGVGPGMQFQVQV